MYRRGDEVIVMLPSTGLARRVVWEVLDSSVLVCTRDGYQAALKSGVKPRVVAYRKWALRKA